MEDGGVTNNSIVVRTRLMGLIRSGSLGADGRLPTERDLCEQLLVGRRAVRLALQSLEAEGLIWRRQGKGTFAGQQPDPTGVLAAAIVGETTPMEVMEARLSIEPVLASLCARRALPTDIERMRHLARRILEARDPDSTELWDGALHRLIAQTAGNRPMMTMFSLLDEVRGSETWRVLRSKARSLETLKVTDRQHHAIIDAIEAGNPEAAAAAMHSHLSTLMQNLAKIEARKPAASLRRKKSPPRAGQRPLAGDEGERSVSKR
jgi:GntR family transcriptional regulator, transcriptional repressor for pyruvate dehydrogenase complex